MEIRLLNFKSFVDSGWQEIKPITLIYGRNASGKSTLIKALIFLSETMKLSEDMTTPSFITENIDLGGFKNLVYSNDVEKKLGVHIRLKGSTTHYYEYRWELEYEKDAQKIIVYQSHILTPYNDREIAVEPVDIESKSLSYQEKKTKFQKLIFCSQAIPGQITEHDSRAEKAFQSENDAAFILGLETEKVLKQLNQEDNDFDLDSFRLGFQQSLLDQSRFGPKLYTLDDNPSIDLTDDEFQEYLNKQENNEYNECLEHFKTCTKELYRTLSCFSYIGPYRKPISRSLFQRQSFEHQTVGRHGQSTDKIFLNNFLLDGNSFVSEVNNLLKDLELGFEIMIEQVEHPLMDQAYVLYLKDLSTQAICGMNDVGHGVSQVFSILVEALNSHSEMIAVEQPELHLHPKQQAHLAEVLFKLTDLYVPSMNRDENVNHKLTVGSKSTYTSINKYFILETHSEYLMLRIQKLIRKQFLKQNNVKILYVDQRIHQDGETLFKASCISTIGLNKYGEMTDIWPHGFFEERYEEDED